MSRYIPRVGVNFLSRIDVPRRYTGPSRASRRVDGYNYPIRTIGPPCAPEWVVEERVVVGVGPEQIVVVILLVEIDLVYINSVVKPLDYLGGLARGRVGGVSFHYPYRGGAANYAKK
jgi:hypothetical protein